MTNPRMQESRTERSYRKTQPHIDEFPDLRLEPDWWSRMMALGSMAVAAAALWFARHPDNVANVDSVNAAAIASMEGDSVKVVSHVAPVREPEGVTPESKSNLVSGIAHAIASHEVDGSARREETTVLRANNANELFGKAAEGESDRNESDRNEPAEHGDSKLDGKDMSTLEEFVCETEMVDVPADGSSDDAESDSSSSVVADESPRLTNKEGLAKSESESGQEEGNTLTLDGFKDIGNGLVVVQVNPQPLASEYAVTLTVRNTSDELAVVSRVLFEPSEIIENVSTEFAARSFGVTSPSELAVAFSSDDNLASKPTRQGRYVRQLADTFQIPADTAVDIRLAIENPEHLGYGLRGELTLEYNVDQSLDVGSTPIAFIGDQDE